MAIKRPFTIESIGEHLEENGELIESMHDKISYHHEAFEDFYKKHDDAHRKITEIHGGVAMLRDALAPLSELNNISASLGNVENKLIAPATDKSLYTKIIIGGMGLLSLVLTLVGIAIVVLLIRGSEVFVNVPGGFSVSGNGRPQLEEPKDGN